MVEGKKEARLGLQRKKDLSERWHSCVEGKKEARLGLQRLELCQMPRFEHWVEGKKEARLGLQL